MIRAVFRKDAKKRIKSFQLRGHADYAEQGEDIICSAVSAIAQTAIGTLDELIEADTDFAYRADDGVISCEIKDYESMAGDKAIAAATVMFSAWVGIRQIADSYDQTYLSVEKLSEE